MELNDRLKDARLKRAKLAELVGVSVKTTYNWGASPPHYVLTIIEQYYEIFCHDQQRLWNDNLARHLKAIGKP